jgi:uncharacterized C2H2 Zn-finger protein
MLVQLPYPCPYCHRAFKKRKLRRKHLRESHATILREKKLQG